MSLKRRSAKSTGRVNYCGVCGGSIGDRISSETYTLVPYLYAAAEAAGQENIESSEVRGTNPLLGTLN